MWLGVCGCLSGTFSLLMLSSFLSSVELTQDGDTLMSTKARQDLRCLSWLDYYKLHEFGGAQMKVRKLAGGWEDGQYLLQSLLWRGWGGVGDGVCGCYYLRGPQRLPLFQELC